MKLLTGQYKTLKDVKKLGFISTYPRFQPAQLEHNLKLVEHVEQVAREKGCTPSQIAINWVRSLSSDPKLPLVLPIPGSSTVERVEENAKLVEFTEEELDTLNGLVNSFETAGGRYPPQAPINT